LFGLPEDLVDLGEVVHAFTDRGGDGAQVLGALGVGELGGKRRDKPA
jgi:hypothetical protein